MLRVFGDGSIFGETYTSLRAPSLSDPSPAGAPPVLALHGWRRDRSDFRVVLDGVDGVAVDLPGFGASPPPPAVWGTEDYAAALDPVLEATGTPVVVLGHSFGGRVAVRLAATRPDVVAGLVLTGVPLLRLAPAAAPTRSYRLARWLNQRGFLSDARMEARRRRSGSADYRAATGVMREVFVRVVNETYDESLAALRCPVALVWGRDDREAPLAIAERVAAQVPGATLSVVDGGHMLPVTHPHELRTALDRLLAPA